jgi:hypothetical protein
MENQMLITVTYDDHKWTISPDPANVSIGEDVEWQFETRQAPYSAMRWTVFFDEESPFQGTSKLSIISKGRATIGSQSNHLIVTKPAVVNKEGDFKYGVQAEDANTDKFLSEDDPWLIVRP